MTMLLAVDVGNSSIHIGIFTDSDLIASFRIPTWPDKPVFEYREEILNHLKGHRIEPKFQGVIISSVVGEVTETLCKGLTGFSLGGPILVGAGLDTGLEFSVDRPEELGSDRIVNAVAACELFKGPSLVVDFGTATTITACNKRKLIGGAAVHRARRGKPVDWASMRALYTETRVKPFALLPLAGEAVSGFLKRKAKG